MKTRFISFASFARASAVFAASSLALLYGQTATVYSGARLITGDGGAPIESGTFTVRDGHIVSIRSSEAPSGARRIDLTGKTVIPAMINVHVHIGYEGYTTWGPANYTPANILDHLEREAFYGIGATQTVGSSPTDSAIEFQNDQLAGKFPAASRFFFVPGMAPPHGGPDATLMKGTSATHAVYEVSTPAEARAAVDSMAAKNLKNVKIWVDDRRGTYPKMPPEVYNAVIAEAHSHGMKVHAHALTLADQKAVVAAGADVLVHIVATEALDPEFLELLKQKRPYWTPVLGLGDRSPVCENNPFVDQVLPDKTIADIRKSFCGPLSAGAQNRERLLAENFPKMLASGVRVVLGTDAGIFNRYSFGWADHHELARYVQFGLTPAQALVAATSRPAELMGIEDMGRLAPGMSADFVVLDGNPLEDFANLDRISAVYLKGEKLDREKLLAKWKTVN